MQAWTTLLATGTMPGTLGPHAAATTCPAVGLVVPDVSVCIVGVIIVGSVTVARTVPLGHVVVPTDALVTVTPLMGVMGVTVATDTPEPEPPTTMITGSGNGSGIIAD